MRTFSMVLAAVLLLIAIAGLGVGAWVMSAALDMRGSGSGVAIVTAIEFAMLPFLVGVIALVGATVAFAVEGVGEQQIDLLKAIRGHARDAAPAAPGEKVTLSR